jgi:NitT/TauT family transport system substrate-binding protein
MMGKKASIISLLLMTILGSALLGACAPAAAPQTAAAETVTLKMALLPILDAVPVFVAQREGLFAKHNVAVEIIPVGSAPERDQVIAAGQADGMVNEIVSVMLYNRDQLQVQIVRYAQAASQSTAHFYILASPQSGITDVSGLKGVEIGISQGTIIEYLTDRLLQAEGLSTADIKSINVPRIPDRLNLLLSGELKAAVLPDPFGYLATQQGAVNVLDASKHPEYSNSVLTFRKAVIDEHPEAIRGFLAAVEEAVALINADPTRFSSVLTEQNLVPPTASGFSVPSFPTWAVPTQAQWDDVLAWAKEKSLLTQDVSYNDSVNASFLP